MKEEKIIKEEVLKQLIDLQKMRSRWFRRTHKVGGKPQIWMREDDWSDMIDDYEKLIEKRRLKNKL